MTGTGAENEASTSPTPTPAPPAVPPVAGPEPAPAPSGGVPFPPPWSGQPATPPVVPQPQWGQPAPVSKPRRSNAGIIAGVVAAAVLLVACLGAVGTFIVKRTPPSAAPAATPISQSSPRTGTAVPSPAVDEEPVVQQGPQASQYPAGEIRDLERVCDENVFYPQSPPRTGKGPHPVALLVADGSGLRVQSGTYYFSEGLSDRDEQTWAPKDAGKVRMVACLDRVSTGAKIRNCKFDDPKPDTLSLMRAEWHLKVYETATGRVLLDKAMPGDDQKCPYVVMVGDDKKIYAEVSDKAMLSALRKLVKG